MARSKKKAGVGDRQGEILKLVIDGYISTGQPVSSLFLTQNHETGVSSATIRSIFSELDKEGYLYSPHRSSGRIPTEKGYRYYVGQMPQHWFIEEAERMLIQKEYLRREFQINEILTVTSRLLSLLTDYAGIVVGPSPGQTVLKHIELIDMGQDEVLLILATRSGMVFHRVLHLEEHIPGESLRRISRYLNEIFKGCDLDEVRFRLAEDDFKIDGGLHDHLKIITRTLKAHFDSVSGKEELFTFGRENLFASLARLNEEERILDVGHLFETPDFLRGKLKVDHDRDGADVLIEGDHDSRLSGISLVIARYKMGEKYIGSLGVVGPNRMDYGRVVGIVNYISHLMSNMVTRISN